MEPAEIVPRDPDAISLFSGADGFAIGVGRDDTDLPEGAEATVDDGGRPRSDSPAFLDVDDVRRRYGIGRTKAYETINQPDFPRSVVPGMVVVPRAALEAWEVSFSLAGTCADPSASSDPAGTHVVAAAPPARAAGRPRKDTA